MWHLLHIILLIKNSLQQQIYFNGNIFGNKCCRGNEGSMYILQYPIILQAGNEGPDPQSDRACAGGICPGDPFSSARLM